MGCYLLKCPATYQDLNHPAFSRLVAMFLKEQGLMANSFSTILSGTPFL